MTGRVTAKKRRPRVVLVMIVKDEAAIIRERLEAVRDQIDGWIIVDTGSTDSTIEEVQAALEVVPGEIRTLPWEGWPGFAVARTYAIREAAEWARWQGGDWWALLLDADTVFTATKDWRQALVHAEAHGFDAVSCDVVHGAIRYQHPRLLRLPQQWRWRGVLHEYLVVDPAKVVSSQLFTVEHGSGGARSKDPQKYLLDAELLRDVRRNLLPDSDDRDLLPRYTFYEAQSWRDGGRPHAAEEAYLERTGQGGFGQEVYLAWLNVGELRLARGDDSGAFVAWTRAWGVDPSRAEALIGLATICRTWESWWPAYSFGRLAQEAAPGSGGMFADLNVGWRADFELGVSAWYCGKLGEGRRACEKVLESELAPEDVKVRAKANLDLYLGAL